MAAPTHHTSQLRPHLLRAAEEDAAPDIWLEKVEVRLGGLRLVELDLLLDLEVLEAHKLVCGIAGGVDVGEDCAGNG